MNVTIVVRSCPDYSKINLATFLNQLNDPYKPHAELKEIMEHSVIETWNNFFAMDFFSYRQEVASIARHNLNNIKCRIVKGFAEFGHWLALKEDEVVVPVDDDDWFSPDIINLGTSFREQDNLVCWNKSTFKTFNRSKFYLSKGFRLASNNWAVRKSWLQSLNTKTAYDFILGSHRHSQTYVEHNLSKDKINVLDANLSVYVRHLGSLVLLRSFCQSNSVVSTLKMVCQRWPTEAIVPPNYNWARDYIAAQHALGYRMRRNLLC